MIGVRTPFRISFFGGGTDLKEFYRVAGGNVLSTSVDKYMYIFINKFFDKRIQVKYSVTEIEEDINKIKHPIVRELLKLHSIIGVDINSIADIPAGTGLGSSSSFTVGLINALSLYKDKILSSSDLAEQASNLEIDILNEPIGKQDQYAAAFGGLNYIKFNMDESVEVIPINISIDSKNKLEEDMLVFYTGNVRKASSILSKQKENILDYDKSYKKLLEMSELCQVGKTFLENNDVNSFEKLLHDSWQLKKEVASGITNSNVNEIYNIGIESGAKGGKLLGAGGGGFILFFCNPKSRIKIKNKLSKLKEVKFKFDSTGSSRIL